MIGEPGVVAKRAAADAAASHHPRSMIPGTDEQACPALP
jgi:hypothetical protein